MSSFPLAPSYRKNNEEWDREQSRVINGLMIGKSNNTGTITLTANSATTTISLAPGLIGADTKLFLFATTANAAAENPHVSAVSPTNNTFTLTHTNNAQTDRTYSYFFIG